MVHFPSRFQVSLNSSLSRSTFPCDMGGKLSRIKSRRVSFHGGESGETLPRERTENNRVEQLRVPSRCHGRTTSVFFKGFHGNGDIKRAKRESARNDAFEGDQ